MAFEQLFAALLAGETHLSMDAAMVPEDGLADGLLPPEGQFLPLPHSADEVEISVSVPRPEGAVTQGTVEDTLDDPQQPVLLQPGESIRLMTDDALSDRDRIVLPAGAGKPDVDTEARPERAGELLFEAGTQASLEAEPVSPLNPVSPDGGEGWRLQAAATAASDVRLGTVSKDFTGDSDERVRNSVSLMRDMLLRTDASQRSGQFLDHDSDLVEAAVTNARQQALSAFSGSQAPVAIHNAVSASAMVQRAIDNHIRVQSEGARGLIKAADGVAPDSGVQTTTSPGQLLTQTQSATMDRALPSWTLNTPLQQPQQWGDAVGERVRWMVNNQLQSAELKINPPQLGPVEIRINMQKDHMNVTFLAQHPLVRETLEDAIPRLRELLGGQGTVNVDVSEHPSPDDRDPGAEAGNALVSGSGADGNDEGMHDSSISQQSPLGLVDLYA